jgi:hypothetical protein
MHESRFHSGAESAQYPEQTNNRNKTKRSEVKYQTEYIAAAFLSRRASCKVMRPPNDIILTERTVI